MLRLAIPLRATTRAERLFLGLGEASVEHGTVRLRSAGGEARSGHGAPEVLLDVHRPRLGQRAAPLRRRR
jgi:hypothetical protein